MNTIKKIAGIENYVKTWKQHLDNGEQFIFKFKKVYKLDHTDKRGYFAKEITELRIPKEKKIGYTLRGRYVVYNTKNALDLTDNKIVL